MKTTKLHNNFQFYFVINISKKLLILHIISQRSLPMMDWSAYETNIKIAQMRHKNPKQYRWANASCRMPTM